MVTSNAGICGTFTPGPFLTDAIDPTAPGPQRHHPNGMKHEAGLSRAEKVKSRERDRLTPWHAFRAGEPELTSGFTVRREGGSFQWTP